MHLNITISLQKRFWTKVNLGATSECWNWTRCKCPRGYGTFTIKGRTQTGAHRMAYMLTVGPIPAGLYVCHSCDNPSCCNPAHLWVGTNAQNQQDASRKGRSAKNWKPKRGDENFMRRCPERVKRCEAHPRAKLTEKVVREARILKSQGLPCIHLAEIHGVSKDSLWLAARRTTWKTII